jgi:hypothetical protein
MSTMDELAVPDCVTNGKQSAEMARIWIVDGNQIVTLSERLWEDPGAWGLMLVDLARHVAKSYEMKGYNQEQSLIAIRAAMDAEWAFPTE